MAWNPAMFSFPPQNIVNHPAHLVNELKAAIGIMLPVLAGLGDGGALTLGHSAV